MVNWDFYLKKYQPIALYWHVLSDIVLNDPYCICLFSQTVEHIISAYRYGSFEKVREFIEFRERLSVSLHYNSLSVDRMLLDIVFGGAASPASVAHMFSFLEIDPEKDEIVWRDQVSRLVSSLKNCRR